MIFDLHSHTTASDGKLTPQALVARAAEKRISVLAITDHDCVDAIVPAQQAIQQQGLAMHLVAGVELSTVWQNKDIHIVGLNLDIEHSALKEFLAAQRERRLARAQLIGQRLEKAGLVGALAGAQAMAGHELVTRAHFAAWIVAQGKAKTMQAVFQKYLSRGNPGYVPPNWTGMAEAIAVIQKSGGVAVLAHPGRYKLSNKWLRMLLADFSQMGGQGMEVAQPQQRPDERRFLADLANQHGLLASQGSDFHYPSPWLELGRNLWLPDEVTPIWHDWTLATPIDACFAKSE
ncbi:RNase RNM [Vibrio stylophorae]|nr:PHP domain-containing protein [Vibrio stylophorae]